MLNIISYIKSFCLDKKDKRIFFWIVKSIGIYPRKLSIYKLALTHSSINKNNNNQSLEFLGDSVLAVVVSEYLYRKYSDRKEGFLSQMKVKITNGQTLSKIAYQENIGDYINKKLNVLLTENILEDTIEALIGAIYIDRGYKKVKKFIINKIVKKHFDFNILENYIFRYKTWCLEWANTNKQKIYTEIIQKDTNTKDIIFLAKVWLKEDSIMEGEATSKKKAEEEAFRKLYLLIKD